MRLNVWRDLKTGQITTECFTFDLRNGLVYKGLATVSELERGFVSLKATTYRPRVADTGTVTVHNGKLVLVTMHGRFVLDDAPVSKRYKDGTVFKGVYRAAK